MAKTKKQKGDRPIEGERLIARARLGIYATYTIGGISEAEYRQNAYRKQPVAALIDSIPEPWEHEAKPEPL